MTTRMQLEDRVAIVTGAARGIGLAVAELLVAHGARVLVADRDADELEAAVRALPADQVEPCAVDLVAEGGAEQVVEAAVARWGALDVVVNNAGFTWDGPIHRMADEQWEAMLAIHATVPFRVLRAAAPHLRDAARSEQEAGVERFRKVVNVTSVSGTMGNAAQANYAAAKAAVVGLTKSLAKEWGPFRVNVNAVAFGFIDTRLTAVVPDHVKGLMEMVTPLGRPGTPREAAGPVLFLCSDLSDYVTGQVLTVSGGLPLGMSS